MALSFDKFLMGFVIFSLVMVGGVFIISDTINNYDLNITKTSLIKHLIRSMMFIIFHKV